MKAENNNEIFIRDPIEIISNIPVFSVKDRYIENYEKIANDHLNAIRRGEDNPFIEGTLWKKMEESTRKLIQKYVIDNSLLLDAGVGLGRLLGPLSNYERYGLDISLGYLEKAKEKGINVIFSKIEDMPYSNDVFDAVCTCDVLEHVMDLNECCRQIIRVLKPGGLLFVRVPFKEDLTVYIQDNLPYEFIHVRAFDEPALRLLFEKIFGLQCLEILPVIPFLQGSARLRIQPLPEKAILKIREIIQGQTTSFDILQKAIMVSAEEFTSWIYGLRERNKEWYIKLEDELVMGIVINAVFKKV